MENKEKEGPSQSQGEANSAENKNMPSEEKKNKDEENLEGPGGEDAIKAEQEKFIKEMQETENLIDPGNEHHHHTDEADKKIG